MHDLTYEHGENERIWLATANSDLRSRVLQLETTVAELYHALATYVVDDNDLICAKNRDLAHCGICRALSAAEAAVEGLRA